jgi:hypothetical protein
LILSMKLHVKYIRSLEESERVRKACLTYLRNWYLNVYPERPDLTAELQNLAVELGGQLEEPNLRWKYAWMKPIFGWETAKWAQTALPRVKELCARRCDEAIYRLEASRPAGFTGAGPS